MADESAHRAGLFFELLLGYMEPLRGRKTLSREVASADELASPKGKEQKYPPVGAGTVLQQRAYEGGPRLPRRRGYLLRAQRQGERHNALHLRDDRGPEDGGRERRLAPVARGANFVELR